MRCMKKVGGNRPGRRAATGLGATGVGVAAMLFGLVVADSAAAATTFSLPLVEDFEGFALGPDSTWICPTAGDCVFAYNANGSSNERNIVSDAYAGTRAYQFVIDTVADLGAYREEGQSHPASNDFFKGDTLWVGYAIKVPVDQPTETHFMSTHQIKLLDPQCQVRLGFENDEWRFREAYSGCGAGVKRTWVGAPLNKGSWQTVIVKHDLSANGGFSVWIDSLDEANPTLTLQNRNVFPDGPDGSPCYLKVGLYEGWWRVNPQDVIVDRWVANYDNMKVCRGDAAGCGFAFVSPGAPDGCGDGTCSANEDCAACEADCGACAESTTGAGGGGTASGGGAAAGGANGNGAGSGAGNGSGGDARGGAGSGVAGGDSAGCSTTPLRPSGAPSGIAGLLLLGLVGSGRRRRSRQST